MKKLLVFAFFLFLLPAAGVHASSISFDNAASAVNIGGSGSIGATFTVDSAATLMVAYGSLNSSSLVGCVQNSTSMSLATSTATDGGFYLVYAYSPHSGSNTVTCTFTGSPSNVNFNVATYKGTDTAGFPVNLAYKRLGPSTSIAIPLTTTVTSWVVAAGINTNGVTTSGGSGTTKRTGGGAYPSNWSFIVDSNVDVASGSTNLNVSFGSSDEYLGWIFSLPLAGSSPTASTSPLFAISTSTCTTSLGVTTCVIQSPIEITRMDWLVVNLFILFMMSLMVYGVFFRRFKDNNRNPK